MYIQIHVFISVYMYIFGCMYIYIVYMCIYIVYMIHKHIRQSIWLCICSILFIWFEFSLHITPSLPAGNAELTISMLKAVRPTPRAAWVHILSPASQIQKNHGLIERKIFARNTPFLPKGLFQLLDFYHPQKKVLFLILPTRPIIGEEAHWNHLVWSRTERDAVANLCSITGMSEVRTGFPSPVAARPQAAEQLRVSLYLTTLEGSEGWGNKVSKKTGTKNKRRPFTLKLIYQSGLCVTCTQVYSQSNWL